MEKSDIKLIEDAKRSENMIWFIENMLRRF